MGKAAHNERIRLRATYYNGLSISVTVVAILLPTLAFVPTLGRTILDVAGGRGALTPDNIATLIVDAVAFIAALLCAALLRRAADREIQKVRD